MIKVVDGAHRFRMRDLQLDGNASAGSTGSCLVFSATAPNNITHCSLENVQIWKAGEYSALPVARRSIEASCGDAERTAPGSLDTGSQELMPSPELALACLGRGREAS